MVYRTDMYVCVIESTTAGNRTFLGESSAHRESITLYGSESSRGSPSEGHLREALQGNLPLRGVLRLWGFLRGSTGFSQGNDPMLVTIPNSPYTPARNSCEINSENIISDK